VTCSTEAEVTRPSITFLTTSGTSIGLGHLRRCLTLASELVERGARVDFALTGDEGGVTIARQAGYDAVHLVDDEQPAAFVRTARSVVVVDDYAVSEASFATLRRSTEIVAVIDDLADRSLEVDLVVNASPNAATLPYRLTPACVRLFGPSYALLRPEFRKLPARQIRERVERVLVTLGGADPKAQTPAVVRALRTALPDATLDVVLGPLFTARSTPDETGCVFHRAPAAGLQPLMLAADLAVAGGGQTTYELAACGLPAVALCLADNQRANLTHLAAANTLVCAEDDGATLARLVERLAGDVAQRRKMSEAGRLLVDGLGASRVAESLMALSARSERVHA